MLRHLKNYNLTNVHKSSICITRVHSSIEVVFAVERSEVYVSIPEYVSVSTVNILELLKGDALPCCP